MGFKAMSRKEGFGVVMASRWVVEERFLHPSDIEFSKDDPDGYDKYCKFVRGLFDELRDIHEAGSVRCG
ncbi:MAG: hypothetical protein EOM01_08480 [Spirochaetia bacterium]|nr:hypothetical protein [Spirochaetia bacterium]